MFGTTLPRTDRPAKLSNQWIRALVREVTKKHDGHSGAMGDTSATHHRSGLYGRLARHRPFLSERHMKARLEFAERLKGLSNYDKQDYLRLNEIQELVSPQFQVSCLEETRHHSSPAQYHPDGAGDSIMLSGCFSAAGTGGLVRVERKLNGTKYTYILNENLAQSAPGPQTGHLKVHLPTGQ